MSAQSLQMTTLSIPRSLKIVGLTGVAWALLTILGAVFVYLPGHPDFSPFNTYLSDIGDTPGWGQITFNTGTLIAAPIRYLVVILLVFRLSQLGAGKLFVAASLVVGFFSTTGTVLMTAVPFSQAPMIHKTGIGLYFLGVVVLQTLIFFREWSLKCIPRILPLLSVLMVVLYFIFVTLIMLYEQGAVSRNTPVIWEWLAILSSIVWMFFQSILLGKED